jgi:acid phosphatase family membrane protein YuiD
MSIDRNNGSRPRLVDPVSEPAREGDDLSLDHAQSSTNRTRQGVTGHNVRYVLVFGLVGVVLAFILIYTAFSG